jgi:uncharacterized protein (TIGR03032 family)
MNKSLPPFSCKFSPQFSELLYRLNCTISLSTYQAGKLIFLSAKDEENIVQLPRTFKKAMGIAQSEDGKKLALACQNEVLVFTDSPSLAKYYPKAPEVYDALYMPRLTYHTGALDLHDLSFGANEELYGVNTLFSCLIKLDSNYNFTPIWKPEWIDRIVSEDRCHLNGMAMKDGRPRFVSAFNTGNKPQSWREDITKTGVIIDIETNEIVCEGLPMPHSPRMFNGKLYVLLSASGELACIDTEQKKYSVVTKLGGFVRGMDLIEDYLFVGISKIRKSSSTFGDLSFDKAANRAAIVAVHLPTGSIAGEITYQNSVDEIYDVNIIQDKTRPNILNTINETYNSGVTIPEQSFWAVPKE